MARRRSPKKTLKHLFSRSEPNLHEPPWTDADKSPDWKKRFKLPKLKIKSKSSIAPESAAEPNDTGEGGDVWADNIVPDRNRSSLYATTSMSKGKELSFSELDLRKPKRFPNFSFGLRKKNKKHDGSSSSVYSSGDGEHLHETHLDPAKTKKSVRKSRAEFDSSDEFDIPPPPPIAKNHTYLVPPRPRRSSDTLTTQPEIREPLTSDILENQKTLNAPIATIPSRKTEQNVTDSCDNDVLQHSDTKTDISGTESTGCTSSHHQRDAPDKPTPQGEPSTAYDTDAIESAAPATQTDTSAVIAESATISFTHSERSTPEPVRSVTSKSALRDERSPSPLREVEIYEALYESLTTFLPTHKPRPQTGSATMESECVEVDAPKEIDKETNDLDFLPSTSHQLDSGHRMDDAAGGYNPINVTSSKRNIISSSWSDAPSAVHEPLNHQRFTSSQTPAAPEAHRDTDVHRTNLTSSPHSHSEPVKSRYSESTHFQPGITSDRFPLHEETPRSAPVDPNSAPPVSDYATSQGTDTHVTNTKRRGIIIKEIVTSSPSELPSPVPGYWTAVRGPEVNTDRDMEDSVAPSGLTEGDVAPFSPSYLSVGSEDGSAVEIYYSAEEDTVEEPTYVKDKREELCFVTGRREELPQQQGTTDGGKGWKDLRGTIVEMEREEKQEPLDSRAEMQQLRGEAQVLERGQFQLHVSNDLRSQETEAKVSPRSKEEGEEKERKEELLATPVQQVNTLMVCEVAPPSRNPHGHGEGSDGNRTGDFETEDPLNGQKQLPSQGIQYLVHKDVRSSKYVQAASGNTRREDSITPEFGEQEKQVSLPAEADNTGKSNKCRYNNSRTAKIAAAGASRAAEVVAGAVTHTAALQSDASEIEHNRAPTSGEWVDPITQRTDTNRTVREQVAVELSVPNADTLRPGGAAAEEVLKTEKHPSEAHRTHGSSSTASEVSASAGRKSDQVSPVKMNLGYSSLSTTLSLKHSPTQKEDEAKHRFRKVSLVREGVTEAGQDTVDLSGSSTAGTESNGSDLGSDYKWKNRFDGVSQYKPYTTEGVSVSDTSSSTSSAVLPEVTANRLSDRSEPAGEPKEHQTRQDANENLNEDDSTCFTGVFQAKRVELVDPSAPFSTPPASPELDSPNQFDMDSLVDTLKNMGPALRTRSLSLRGQQQGLSALPPIVEDASSPATSVISNPLTNNAIKITAADAPVEARNHVYTMPADLGLKRTANRDSRSPLELMKQGQQDNPVPGTRGLILPQRASTANSIVMRSTSDYSPEDSKSSVLSENGVFSSSNAGSRLENSVIFGSYRSTSVDQSPESAKAHRSLFRASSLPDTGPLVDRKEFSEVNTGTDPPGSRFERLSFLLNSSSSSLTGGEEPSTPMNRLPPLSISSPPSSNSPTRLLSPTGSIDLHRQFNTTDSPLSRFGPTAGLGMGVGPASMGPSLLQRSFSNEGTMGVQQNALFNSMHGGPQVQVQRTEPDRNLAGKYRAFPDAYLTKEKEHGKLNPRPGKMYVFDRPGMCGQRIEVRSDVIDATSWELQDTISIRVIRGGWVLYEKPDFKGEKIALDEGDIELTCPFLPPEEEEEQQPNIQKEGEEQKDETSGETSDEQTETKPTRRFIIGSVRRAVRDYSVPEISLFPEENAEGKKVIFRDTSEDARIFGFPIKANSIIINAGLWLVFAQPFFEGVPRVLEVGGYSNPEAWGVEQPYVGSVHPLKVGEPRVEIINEPKMVIYDKPYFTGKSRTLTTDARDFMSRTDRQQTAFMYNVGSLKILGGIWVGYEKEGFRGHQYLLEEGEYHDWRVWGGCDLELRSVRVIRADLTEPLMVMFEQPEEEGLQEDNTFEVTDAIPDVELFGYKTSSRSIQVLSGAWIAYSHVDFSGSQYILEKGFYNNCADWGSLDNRICSVQPILLAPSDRSTARNQILLYSEPDFKGETQMVYSNKEALSEKLLTKSCRVSGGSWVLYENTKYSGNMYVLSEGDYPNLTGMGCQPDSTIRSVKAVPTTLSVPSISLFGLECLEGKEITTDAEIFSMLEEGFNNHILSVRVNSGCWVIFEHSNYRGRQFLLEPIEITNWPKFSSIQTVGSMYPVRQMRHCFRIKNRERGHFMSIQGGVEEMKSGRVVVTPEVEPMSDIWFYQDGVIKNKLSTNMNLQVMGNIEPGAKLVLWAENRQPIQTWTAKMRGLIVSLTFPGMVLDVKGGKTYDKDHVVIMPESDERPSQHWEIELL